MAAVPSETSFDASLKDDVSSPRNQQMTVLDITNIGNDGSTDIATTSTVTTASEAGCDGVVASEQNISAIDLLEDSAATLG